ncbi:MAG TPA: BCAM0308 family protein [Candidatus Deferrimicrobiaceae bacterium]
MLTTTRFDPAHRKNVHRDTDPYMPHKGKAAPRMGVCPACHAVRDGHRWLFDDRMAAMLMKRTEGVDIHRCPACRKTADGFPFGLVTLEGGFLAFHHDEIVSIVRNEEKRAMAANPMARIMTLNEADGRMEIATTDEKLAQRIGREVHKACRGEVEYTWSDDVKLLRVHWMRDA